MKGKIKQFFQRNFLVAACLLFLFVFTGAVQLFANNAPPDGGYTPGSTLDPNCDPTDPNDENCKVNIAGSFVPYTGATDNLDLGLYGLTGTSLNISLDIPTYTATNSPVVWNGQDYYITGDFSVMWLRSDTENIQGLDDLVMLGDDGNTTPQNLIGFDGTQDTIYVYAFHILDEGNQDIYGTIYSAIDSSTILTFFGAFGLTGSITIDYSEPAFILDPVTKEYTNVMTLPIASPSGNTTWTDPAAITKISTTTKSFSFNNGLLQFVDGNEGLGKVLTSDANGFATWQAGGWSLEGNAGTVDGESFIGTTDDVPLTFKVKGIQSGKIDHIFGNTLFGYGVGKYFVTESSGSVTGINIKNGGTGYDLLTTVITIDPPVSGTQATAEVLDVTAPQNEIQSVTAGDSSTPDKGTYTIFFDGETTISLDFDADSNTIQSELEALSTIGNGNILVTGDWGTSIIFEFTNALGNVDQDMIKLDASNLKNNGSSLINGPNIQENIKGDGGGTITKIAIIDGGSGYTSTPNVAVTGGDENASLTAETSIITETVSNSAFGTSALRDTTGSLNTAVGFSALFQNTRGIENTAVGANTLTNNNTGSYLTVLGANANVSGDGLSNATAIGYGATVSSDNTIQLGNTSVTNINTSGTLTLNGIIYPNTDGSVGQVLSTNGSGTLGWTTISASDSPITIVNSTNLFSTGLTGTGSGVTVTNGSIFLGPYAGFGATSASYSNFLGQSAGYGADGAYSSNFLGQNAGSGATGASSSNFFGESAGGNATGAYQSNFFGLQAGQNATGAYQSNFLGTSAGIGATGAFQSNFLGQSAGSGTSNAYRSNFLGSSAGQNAWSANMSNFFGDSAGFNAGGAYMSNFFGSSAGYNATNANNSNFFGASAGISATNANDSNFLGQSAGISATNANNSNFFGIMAGFGATNASNSIFIGQSAGTGDTVNNTGNADDFSILIGKSTSTGGFGNSIAIGGSATNTAVNQFMIGSTTRPIDTTVWKMTTGDATLNSTGIITTSDERLKQNIVDLPNNLLDKLIDVRTVNFNWIKGDTNKINIGFIAQDLEQYFPELVYEGTDGFKGVNYANMTPVIVEAIRELDLKIGDLTKIETPLFDEENNKTFVGLFFDRLVAWFADSTNGISEFVGEVLRAKDELCIGEGADAVCITKEELLQMKNNTVGGNSSSGGSFVDGGAGDEIVPTCSDGIQNQDETDVDTGGVCTTFSEDNNSGAEGDQIGDSDLDSDAGSDLGSDSDGDLPAGDMDAGDASVLNEGDTTPV